LYLELGEPGIPGQPFADRAAAGGEGGAGTIGGPQIEAMVAQLAARLEEAPDDLQGWKMLGRSYAVLERFSEAAEAYARAFALDDADPAVAAAYGEALMRANNGTVTAEARTAFAAVLAADPKEPQARFFLARFFLGLAKVQEGRPREGLEAWEALVADSPPDAPWLPALENEISQLKQSLGEGR
jgi:cytochrome c-type biogenesis protein CcmH